MTWRQAFVGAGANLGDRAASLAEARRRLEMTSGIATVEASPIYETDPVGLTDQPRFLNQVLGIETTLAPEQLLRELQRIERELGRQRTVRWGPRTLDLDLLAYEGEQRETAELTLPHPRMLERDFVTIPLRDLLTRPCFHAREWKALQKQLGPGRALPKGVQRYPG